MISCRVLSRYIRAMAFLAPLADAMSSVAAVRYVDASAPSAGNGVAWSTAHRYLQDAFTDAANPNHRVTEIHVAHGLYKPDQGIGYTFGDKSARFLLLSGVALMGGYAGLGAPDPDARDFVAYETILSGDLFGNDLPGASLFDPSLADNSIHVIVAQNVNASAKVEGLALNGGIANGSGGFADHVGGGLLLQGANPTINDCTFQACRANEYGGAAGYVGSIAVTHSFLRCKFQDNRASGGGGLYADGAVNLTLTDCTLSQNQADDTGGAIYKSGGALTCTNVTFDDNSISSGNGGGAVKASGVALSLVDCTFSANHGSGGGLYCSGTASITTLSNCDFVLNSGTDGAAIYFDLLAPSTMTVTSCSFELNDASGMGGAIYNRKGSAVYQGCALNGNHAGIYGGALDDEQNVTLNACSFSDNTAGSEGGAIYLLASAIFNDVTFDHNSTAMRGGGVALCSGEIPKFNRCVFRKNQCTTNGGGVASHSGGAPKFNNCLFTGNTAGFGGAVYINSSSGTNFADCTLAGNVATTSGGGVFSTLATTAIANCVLWDNADNSGMAQSSQVFYSTGTPMVSYCCVEGWTGSLGGAGNFGMNPMFIDGDGLDNVYGTADDNSRLAEGSPCIDSGNNAAVPTTVMTDLDGNPRFVDDPAVPDSGNGIAPLVDRGAYEFQPPPPPCPADIAPSGGNGAVDVDDLLAVINAWGQAGGPADIAPPGGDGMVNVDDLLAVINSWGPCP